MKLEKISDTQIRCTLNRDDLIDRELRISELAYGSEKAKSLFRDMIQQAAYEFGFEADDIPLMIESIPISPDCLVFNITKVEDPDELDTRFSNFTPAIEAEDSFDDDGESYADEILNCFEQIADIMGKRDESMANNAKSTLPEIRDRKDLAETVFQSPLIKIYSFSSLKEVTSLSHILIPFYSGENTLYKNPLNGRYYMIFSISEHTPEEFNKVCNIVSEFGKTERTTYASTSYFEEHYESIIQNSALQILHNL